MNFISAIIPSKNRNNQLIQAVISLYPCELINEIVIVNDSKDNSIDIEIFNHINTNNKIVIINNNRTAGAQGSRIAGAIYSKNDILLYLDSDDTIIENGIIKMHHEITQVHNLALVYANVKYKNKTSDFIRIDGYDFRKVLKNLSLCQFSGLMVRKSLIQWDQIDQTLPSWQDDDFCLSICKRNRIKFIDTLSATIHLSNDSISKSKSKQFSGLSLILNKWKQDILIEFGFSRLFLWRIRLILLLFLTIAEDARISINTNPKKKYMFYIFYYIFLTLSYVIRFAIQPFFDRYYV